MKLKKMTKTMMWIMMTALVFVSAAVPSAVFASENVPVNLEIPITYIVHGNDKRAGGDTFVLTADEPEGNFHPFLLFFRYHKHSLLP